MQQRADLERRMVSGFMRWLDRKERLVVIHVVLSILSKSYPAKDCENACFSVAWMCNSLRRRFHRVRATPTVRRRRLRPRHFSQSGRCLLHHRSESPRRSLLSLAWRDRKSTRLNSSHGYISYAVFCLKKKKKTHHYLH